MAAQTVTFARDLLTRTIHLALFNNHLVQEDKLYFSKDFIREHKLFLKSNDGCNMWLRATVVQVLFSLGKDDKDCLRNFYLHQLPIFSGKSSSSDEKLIKYLDGLLGILFDQEQIDQMLIECICIKLENLTTISEREINTGYITRGELDEIIAWFLD